MPHKGYKQTEEHRKKISENHANISGDKNPMYGKHHTPETKKKLSAKMTGNKHHNWKGGRRKDNDGYVKIYKPEHPRAYNNYVLEHILVAEEMLGRPIKKGEPIHHINFNRSNNNPKNLHVFENNSKHQKVKKSYFELAPILMEKGIIEFDKEKEEYILN